MLSRQNRVRGLIFIISSLCVSAHAQHADVQPNGKALFERSCAVCHGMDANGDTDFFPSLLKAANNTNPTQFARVILNGQYDPAEGDAGHSPPLMPPWSHLSNEDIAALTNYIYKQTKLEFNPLTPTDVDHARGGRRSAPEVPLPETELLN